MQHFQTEYFKILNRMKLLHIIIFKIFLKNVQKENSISIIKSLKNKNMIIHIILLFYRYMYIKIE